jgi:Fe-S-cluster-containing dehydrogenase component
MERVALLTDIDLCYGCLACETACQQEHNLPAGTKWMKVVRVGPEEIGGRLVMDFVPMHCRHCEDPLCVEVCPGDAIERRPDGIVLHGHENCIGCGLCIEICPFGAPQYNPVTGRTEACNLCYERLDRGLLPACVQNCPTGALVFGAPGDYTEAKRRQQASVFIKRRALEPL